MEVELEITDISRGGAGIGKDSEGRAIFVPLTAPGDRVKAKIWKTKKNYAFADLVEILKPSPMRVTPRCKVFGICGGCEWQHIPYEEQWKIKTEGVIHALSRTQVTPPQSITRFPAENPWNYRNRIQLRGDHDKMGYFQRGTRALVGIEECPIADTGINHELLKIRKDAQSRFSRPFKVEIEKSSEGKIVSTFNSPHASLGFRQINAGFNQKLRDWIFNESPNPAWVFDLFGGDGNLSFNYIKSGIPIHVVDVSVPTESDNKNLNFHKYPVGQWLRKSNSEQLTLPNGKGTVLCDPPREGIRPERIEIKKMIEIYHPKTFILVGCDPDAFASDVRFLLDCGARLQSMALFDFFPQTHHIESAARLTI